MLAKRRLSIREKLIIIYMLIAIPLVILLGLSFIDRYQESLDAALNERLQIARLSASNFSLFVNQIVNVEEAIGVAIVNLELETAPLSTFLSQVVENYPASYIAFLDASGSVTAASQSNIIGQDLSNNPAIRAIINGESSSIGNLQQNANGSPEFIIATAIRGGGALAGIVSMSIRADELGNVLDIAVRRGGVNIVDANGFLVFQSQISGIPFNQRDLSDEEFIQVALSGRIFSSTGLVFPIDQSFRTGVEIPIPDIGWATGSFVPVESVLAPIRIDAIISALIALLLLLITLSLAFMLGNRLAGGIITLKDRMRTAPQVNFTERIAIRTGDEIEELAESFNRLQDEISSAQAVQAELQRELQNRNNELSELYRKQKDVASVLQESLLPKIVHKIDSLETGIEFQSATEAALVGGDFFDFFEVSDDKFGIVIGDVSGKGIDAATLAATIRNTLRAFAYEEETPAKTLSKVNRVAVIETPRSIFVTLFFGVFDSTTRNFVYANAGHWPPIVLNRAKNIFSDLETGSIPLGVFTDAVFTDHSIQLEPDSITALFTDGIIESRTNGAFFGVESLKRVIAENSSLSPGELAKIIVEEAKAFGGGKLYDDAAVMLIRILPNLSNIH